MAEHPTHPLLVYSLQDALVRKMRAALGSVHIEVMPVTRVPDLLAELQRPWGLIVIDTSLSASSTSSNSDGLDLLEKARAVAPDTPLIALVAERDLELFPRALQLGVSDVLMLPLRMVELKARVLGRFSRTPTPAGRPHAPAVDHGLLSDLASFHEYCLREYIELERKLLDIRQRFNEVSGLVGDSSGAQQRLLLVHPDPGLGEALQALQHAHAMVIHQEFTGGSALERATESEFDAVICSDELPDLEGAVVATSLKGELPYIDAVYLEHWGSDAGRAVWIDLTSDRRLVRPARTLAELQELVIYLAARKSRRSSDKALSRAFREQHREFMRQYAEVKLRLFKAMGRDLGGSHG